MDRRRPASWTTARIAGTPQREFDEDEEYELTELGLTEDELELTWLPEPLEFVEVETEEEPPPLPEKVSSTEPLSALVCCTIRLPGPASTTFRLPEPASSLRSSQWIFRPSG